MVVIVFVLFVFVVVVVVEVVVKKGYYPLTGSPTSVTTNSGYLTLTYTIPIITS